MEIVFDALKKMGKASSIEIAARTGKDRQQTVNELWDLKRAGLVGSRGTAWFILEQGKRTESDLSDLEAEVMEVWSVNSDKAVEAESNCFSSAENITQSKETTKILQSIPSFTETRRNDVTIPAPRFISAEIRRTEAKLKRLQAMRELSREVHKPGNRRLWQQISPDVV
ncbi:hypothetical protein ZU49_002492 [Salmonella enterica subsp. enterica]|nr:hypothetical protein [Salmonella enterica subsp. enterica]